MKLGYLKTWSASMMMLPSGNFTDVRMQLVMTISISAASRGMSSPRFSLTGPSGDGAVGILGHSGEMDGDPAVTQHPAVGEPHVGFPVRTTHGDCLDDHQGLGVIRLRPEGNV